MAVFGGYSENNSIRFDVNEFTGALGDSITVLPIVVALGVLTPLPLAPTLVLFGVFQVVWGIHYGMPMSVEPMKALAGLAIAGAIGYGELLAAGVLAGVVLLLAGWTGSLTRIQRVVGTPVVRGIQLGVGLVLAVTGLELAAGDPGVAALAVGVTIGMVALGYRRASALAVLGFGGLLAVSAAGAPTPSLPSFSLFPAGTPQFSVGAVEGTAAQLAMTVGNAAVATSLLCSDLFDRDVSPDDLAGSMGAMCLAAVPVGAVPMCHGSGGLAGKHAFGARTGGANLILGGLYLLAALVVGIIAAFPMAVLGVLLVVIAVELARSAAVTENLALTIGIGVLALVANIGIAFVVGILISIVRRRY